MKQISAKQNICVFITFLISSIPMISGYTQARQDIWLSYIIAFLAIVPLTLLYVRMCSLYPEKNLFEIFGETCGRKIGVVLSALYILYLLNIAGVSLRISSEFIHVISLTETPQWVLLLSFFILCAYGAYKGYEGIARFSAFILPITLLMLVGFLIFSSSLYDWSNIEPIYTENFPEILNSSWTVFVYPFGELLASYFLFSEMKLKKGKGYLPYLVILSVSFLTLILMVVNNILVLGAPSMTRLYFPTYMANSIINLGDFSGTETLSSTIFFIANIIKCIICLIAAQKGIYYIFPKLQKTNPAVVTIFSAACCLFANFFVKNTVQLFDFFYLYRWYALFFQLFPILIWIIAEIKGKKSSINRRSAGNN